jgi:SAM-dependent methyltransferase
MLALARVQAPTAHLLQADLVRLDGISGPFDLACCLFSTLGMVQGDANRRAVVRHAFRLLRPGGTFIVHVHNYWWSLWDPPGRAWALRDLWGGSGDRPMPAHQGVAGLALHHFTRNELIRLLSGEGFVVTEVLPLGLAGVLASPRWLSWLRAYGYLAAARRPDGSS